MAQPQAAAAVNAKYASLGSPTGVLGNATTLLLTDPKTGVSHVDYANGSIYYTAATNAHAMYGDIYKKWIASGGEAFFGYPITDEASTDDKLCRFNNFSNGGAIYWNSATGAYLIYGDIYKKWIASGGESVFGYPITDEASTDGKKCRFNNFSNGNAIYWSAATGAHLIYGEIYKKWVASGGEASFGYPITDEASTNDKLCRFNNFSNGGAIYWTATTRAHLIYGGIYEKWIESGGEAGFGYPITDETSTADGTHRFNEFSNGDAIFWSAATGAYLTYGEIYKKWKSLGGEGGALGYPITGEAGAGTHGGQFNDFKNGTIYWSPLTGAHEHIGPLQDHLEFDANWVFPDGVAAGGDTHIILYSNGTVEFKGHFHDSGAVGYNYGVAIVLVDADRQAYSVSHSGHISGTFDFGGNRNDDWDNTTGNEAVSQDWRAIVADMSWRGDAQANVDIAGLLNDVVNLVKTVGPIVGTIIALF